MEACIDTFGAHRCRFENNLPMDKVMCSYPVLNAFRHGRWRIR
jgi:L-fuconolactonase